MNGMTNHSPERFSKKVDAMSRSEESKIAEHDGRLDEMTREIHALRIEKEEPEKEMTKVRVVAVEFKKEQYRLGEDEVNRNLSDGFVIQKEFQTESGVVIFMTKWEKPKKMDGAMN